MWFNPIIKFLLLSPLHGLFSRGILLLTYTGRRSGRKISTPLSYTKENNDYLIVALRRRIWWRNFQTRAPVTIRVRGKDLSGNALAISEPAEDVQAALNTYLKSQKNLARALDVSYDNEGQPDPETLAKAAENRVIVRVQLD
jgi:hypothetical protein